LIADVFGGTLPGGKSRRFPGAVDWVTVVLMTIEVAPTGTPH
jgi:hypothetical protein